MISSRLRTPARLSILEITVDPSGMRARMSSTSPALEANERA